MTNATNNMLAVLNDSQEAQLIALAESQVDSINQYAYKRFLLMKAFRRQLEGDIPTGSTGLDETAVKTYSAQLYHLDGEISFQRATVMGGILAGLDATQRATLDALKGKGMLEWPDVADQLAPQKFSQDVHVAVMTDAGDLFSWYLGSIEADVYFAPERQGTYFGSFYMKDAPAMGNPDYTSSSTLTGDSGQELLNMLTTEQAQLLTDLVDIQRTDLLAIVKTRMAVSAQLHKFITGGTADSATVLSLMEQYGELDGEIVYQYATHFAQVGQSLTEAQKTQLTEMRVAIMGDFSTPPAGAFLYSNAIAMPEIPNTDFLFGVGTVPTDTEMTTATPTDTGTTTTPVTPPETGTTTTPPPVPETGTTTPETTITETCSTVPWTPTGIYRGQNQWGVLSLKSSSPQEFVATDDTENPYFSHTTKGVSTYADGNGARLYTNCTDSPPNTFKIETTRVNRENGCVTVLYGTLFFPDDSHAEYQGNGSDGLCDLSKDFVETIILMKEESPATGTTTLPDTGTTTLPPVTETETTTPPDTGTTTLLPVTETGTITPPVDTTGTETTTTRPPTTDAGTTPTTPPIVTPVTTPATTPTTTPTTTVASSVTHCTGSSTLGGTCNASGNTITVTEVKASGHLANGTLNSTLTSQGWVSNIITAKGKLVGGVVTGYIKNEGVMMDFVFKGASIIGGTLGGTIQNDSAIKGFFKDVTLLANTKITGGVLKGTIQGDKKAPALLEQLTIKAGSHLAGVKLGKGVKVEKAPW